jgi:hypothetical protein
MEGRGMKDGGWPGPHWATTSETQHTMAGPREPDNKYREAYLMPQRSIPTQFHHDWAVVAFPAWVAAGTNENVDSHTHMNTVADRLKVAPPWKALRHDILYPP